MPAPRPVLPVTRPLAAWLLLAALQPPCALSAASRSPDRARSPPAPDACLGRFRFATPPGLRASSSEFAIYGTQVEARPLAGQPADVAWEAHLAALRADPKNTEVEPFELPSGLRGVTYREGPLTLLVEGFTPRGDEALWLMRDLSPGKLPVAQQLLEGIAAHWVSEPSHGFCFGAGAIHLQSLSEGARVRLVKDALAEFSVEVDTLTVQSKAKPELDLDEARDFARLTKAKLQILRDRRRRVAGLAGTERWISMTLPDQRELVRFSWAFEGEPRRAEAPRVGVNGIARGEDRAALEAAWELLLESMQRIPLAPQPTPPRP